jgi:hypothetical protein
MKRPAGRRDAVAIAVVTPLAVLAVACSGSSSGAQVAQLGATATNGSMPPSTAPSAQGTGALAFARCMRAHGLTNWPDPDSNGAFDKSKLQQAGYGVAQVQALEEGACNNLLPTQAATPSPVHITAQERQDYLSAAACMRSHGITNFPDPTFPNGSVSLSPPPGLETNSALFAAAEGTCKKLIPAGLPYSEP